MFVRLKKVKDSKGKIHLYEQIVESYRAHGKIKQKVVLTLGKKDEISPQRIQSIIRALVKKDPTLELVRKFDQKASDIKIHDSKIYGSYVIFRHLWKLLHLETAMKKIAPVQNKDLFEEMVFMLTLSRIISPASDRKTLHVFEPSVYHRLGTIPKLNRWYEIINRLQKKRSIVEQTVADRVRTLFEEDWRLLYFDTTSLVLFGQYENSHLVQYGYSKDKRNDKKQVIVGLVVSSSRLPVGVTEEVGSQNDVKNFVFMLRKMKEKYGAEKMIFVGDKGMNSKRNREELDELREEYILGVRAQKEKKVTEAVSQISFAKAVFLSFSGNQQKLLKKLGVKNDVSEYQTKVVEKAIDRRRMIFMLNPFEKSAERNKRAKIIEALTRKIKSLNDIKTLIGNRGYRSLLTFASLQKDREVKVTINREKLDRLEQLDGITVIETNTALPAVEIATQYKQLITVEQSFSDLKSMLNIAPIYHKTDANIRGHIFINFLALTLYATLFHILGDGIGERNRYEILNALEKIQIHTVEQNGRKYLLRTELTELFQNICSLLKLKPPSRIIGV